MFDLIITPRQEKLPYNSPDQVFVTTIHHTSKIIINPNVDEWTQFSIVCKVETAFYALLSPIVITE